MIALGHLLAPSPRLLTPERSALAAVALLAAAATPTVIATMPESRRELGDNPAAPLLVVAITVVLSVVLARRALAASSSMRARAWLICGGFVAGAVNALTSYSAVRMLRGGPPHPHADTGTVLLACICVGGPLGSFFGVAYGPVVAAAVRARLVPSGDAGDRVLFASGASLMCLAAAWALASSSLEGPPTCALAGIVGAIAATIAAARLVLRVRLLRRVRDGVEIGVHLVPRSDRDDEAALVPLVLTEGDPSGVIAVTGVSAPYRGARGVFKLALAPLPEDPFERPVVRMLRGPFREIGHTLFALTACVAGLWGLGMVAFAVILMSSGGWG